MEKATAVGGSLWDTTFASLKSDMRLVAVYTNPVEDTRFGLGRILGIGASHISLAMVDTMGYFDGFRLVNREWIHRIMWQGAYINAREAHARESIPDVAPLCMADDPTVAACLEKFRADRCLCEFGLEYVHTGFVLDFDECSVIFDYLDEESGDLSGFCQIPLKDIRSLEIQSQALQRQHELLKMQELNRNAM